MFNAGPLYITIEQILQKVSEEDLLAHYFGITKIPCVINSPLRPDKNPSFSIYYKQNFKIGYFDFANKESGGLFDLLMHYLKKDLQSVLNYIYQDLPNITLIPDLKIYKSKKIHVSDQCDLGCVVRPWKDYDLEYWKFQGITLPWLKFGNIYPITDIVFNTMGNKSYLAAEKYAYVYVEQKDDISIKIYQPFSSRMKWLNNHNASVWDLWNQLPPSGENLIITSSRKDALCIWSNTGIPSTGLQAESVWPKKHVVEQLKQRFKNCFILYDNDFNKPLNYGQEYGIQLANEFDLINICIPTNLQSKDPSELFCNHGRSQLVHTITQLITL